MKSSRPVDIARPQLRRRGSLPCLKIAVSTSSSRPHSARSGIGPVTANGALKSMRPQEHSIGKIKSRPSGALQLRQLSCLPGRLPLLDPSENINNVVNGMPMCGAPALALRRSRTSHMPLFSQDGAVALDGWTEESSEVGMMKLIYQKTRSIREARRSWQAVPQSSLKELVNDFRSAYRICTKAKLFIDLALEGVMRLHTASAEHQGVNNFGMELPMQELGPVTPVTAKETVAIWSSLASALDLSPCSKHSCSENAMTLCQQVSQSL